MIFLAVLVFICGSALGGLARYRAWSGEVNLFNIPVVQLDLLFRTQHYTPSGTTPKAYKSCMGVIFTQMTFTLSLCFGIVLISQNTVIIAPRNIATTEALHFEPQGLFKLDVEMYCFCVFSVLDFVYCTQFSVV